MHKTIVGISGFIATLVAVIACSSGNESSSNPQGVACGQSRCSVGQICCIDCDGRGSCGSPGSVCTGAACSVDSGIGGGSNSKCGDSTCSAGQVCCLDCDGHGACGSPGSVCAGYNCPRQDAGSGTGGSGTGGSGTGGSATGGSPGTGGVTATGGAGGASQICGSTVCGAGMRCCDHCTSRCVSATSGQMCPDDNDPNRTCTCGHAGESCCQATLSACNSGLVCCAGNPYPASGLCETQCTLKSDYNAKTDFSPVSSQQVLDRLDELSITTWRYVDDGSGRHMGPMAQEFRQAFGLGDSEKTIHAVDGLGVSLSAIQALSSEVRALKTDNAALERRLSDLERRCPR